MDILATNSGCLLPLRRLLTSGELGWPSLLKFFLNLVHGTFVPLLGRTWDGINMIGMINECTLARKPKTRACTRY
jgi:hypothetical protein